MDLGFWVGVGALFAGAFGVPIFATLVMFHYFQRTDRAWTNSNRLIFPWRLATVSACAGALALAYCAFGLKPVVGWLAPRLIAIERAGPPISTTESMRLDQKTIFWAGALSADRKPINDASGVNVAAWVTRDPSIGKCTLNRDDYRVSTSSAGFNVPSPVKADGTQPGQCSIGWQWSVTPIRSGTYVIEVGLDHRRSGKWHSEFVQLTVKVAHDETPAERFGWMQTIFVVFATSILSAIAKTLIERMLEKRASAPDVGAAPLTIWTP
jgi:hypothetical protein